MKTKRILLSVILFLIFQATFSQDNYLSGFVIQLNGDTLKGFIDYRNWEKNPNKISFKEKMTDKKIDYHPLEIKEFSVSDDKYEGAVVKTELSPLNVSDLTTDEDLKFKTDTIFLQTIIKGKKCLYFYHDKSGKNQFYIKNDTVFELLVYKKYISEINGMKLIEENKIYISQLKNYFNEFTPIIPNIDAVNYQKKKLIEIFHSYYNSSKSKVEYEKKTESIKIEMGVLGGLFFSGVKFNDSSRAGYENIEFDPSTNISLGLSLNLLIPRTLSRWSIYNEMIFNDENSNTRSYNIENENIYTITQKRSKFYVLKMNNMLRFQYPVKKAFVFVNGGLSNGIGIEEITYKRTESFYYSIKNVEEQNKSTYSSKLELGLNYGFGIKYKKMSVELRVESSEGIFEIPKINSVASKYYLLIGYKL
jgi:hypothetical protein